MISIMRYIYIRLPHWDLLKKKEEAKTHSSCIARSPRLFQRATNNGANGAAHWGQIANVPRDVFPKRVSQEGLIASTRAFARSLACACQLVDFIESLWSYISYIELNVYSRCASIRNVYGSGQHQRLNWIQHLINLCTPLVSVCLPHSRWL